jgi:hypothetical protein
MAQELGDRRIELNAERLKCLKTNWRNMYKLVT